MSWVLSLKISYLNNEAHLGFEVPYKFRLLVRIRMYQNENTLTTEIQPVPRWVNRTYANDIMLSYRIPTILETTTTTLEVMTTTVERVMTTTVARVTITTVVKVMIITVEKVMIITMVKVMITIVERVTITTLM